LGKEKSLILNLVFDRNVNSVPHFVNLGQVHYLQKRDNPQAHLIGKFILKERVSKWYPPNKSNAMPLALGSWYLRFWNFKIFLKIHIKSLYRGTYLFDHGSFECYEMYRSRWHWSQLVFDGHAGSQWHRTWACKSFCFFPFFTKNPQKDQTGPRYKRKRNDKKIKSDGFFLSSSFIFLFFFSYFFFSFCFLFFPFFFPFFLFFFSFCSFPFFVSFFI